MRKRLHFKSGQEQLETRGVEPKENLLPPINGPFNRRQEEPNKEHLPVFHNSNVPRGIYRNQN
jgi:hypothetical protein